jgi:hypothetical protein
MRTLANFLLKDARGYFVSITTWRNPLSHRGLNRSRHFECL